MYAQLGKEKQMRRTRKLLAAIMLVTVLVVGFGMILGLAILSYALSERFLGSPIYGLAAWLFAILALITYNIIED